MSALHRLQSSWHLCLFHAVLPEKELSSCRIELIIGRIQLFARVAPGSAMLAETNRILLPEPQLCKPKRKKRIRLKAAEWEQLAVTSQNIVQAATEAASLALPHIASDIRSFGKDAQVVCHRVELPLSLRQEGSTGLPAAIAALVRLDDAARSRCVHHSRFHREQREAEKQEREKLRALQPARAKRLLSAQAKGLAMGAGKGVRKPLTLAKKRSIAEEVFEQLIGKG